MKDTILKFIKSYSGYALGTLLCLFQNSSFVYGNTLPGTLVENSASIQFDFLNQTQQQSAKVQFVTARQNGLGGTPSDVDLFTLSSEIASYSGANVSALLAGAQCQGVDGSFQTIDSITASGSQLNLPAQTSLVESKYLNEGNPLVVRVEDLDRNLDPTTVEQVEIRLTSDSGDEEILLLAETDESTGIFIGAIESNTESAATSFDCVLTVGLNSEFTIEYIDPVDPSDSSLEGLTFNPMSRVFDSKTGEPIDGVSVRLRSSETNQESPVFDPSGQIQAPSTLVSGEPLNLDNGDVYPVARGGVRFTSVPPGDYYLEVDTPINYSFPTQKSDEELSSLLGDKNYLAIGSKGEVFSHPGGPLLLDIPLDPRDNQILVSKKALKNNGAIGDFVPFEITVANGDIPAVNPVLQDILPVGMRFIKGSVLVGENSLPDPVVSNDGRTLNFAIGNMDANSDLTIKYLTQITILAKDELINRATVIEPNLVSNTSLAKVSVFDDLMANSGRILGSVAIEDCSGSNLNLPNGVPGIRVLLEDGRYVVSDETGRFHFENVSKGTHVIQLDLESLPAIYELSGCNTELDQSAQFVEMEASGIWQTHFKLKLKEPKQGELRQQIRSKVIEHTVSVSDSKNEERSDFGIDYEVEIEASEVEVENLKLLVKLPQGTRYNPNSSMLDHRNIPDPEQFDQQTLMYRLPLAGTNFKSKLTFISDIENSLADLDSPAQAMVMFDSPGKKNQSTGAAKNIVRLKRPPSQEQLRDRNIPHFSSFEHSLTEQDLQALDELANDLKNLRNLKIAVIGHTDNQQISQRSRKIFKDNYELSLARATAAGSYLQQKLGLKEADVLVKGMGPDQPVAKNNNRENRSKNRRVEVEIISASAAIEIDQNQDIAEQKVTIVEQAPILDLLPIEDTASGADVKNLPAIDSTWFENQTQQSGWVWPQADYIPSIPAIKLAFMHRADEKLVMKLNGKPVNPLNFESAFKDPRSNRVVSVWRGVEIKPGPNEIVAELTDKDGNEIERIARDIYYADIPAKAILIEEESKLVANGIETPIVALQLLDKRGMPIRAGLQGEFSVNDPYRPFLKKNLYKQGVLSAQAKPVYQVADNGMIYIQLEPTIESGKVELRLPFHNGIVESISLWLKSQPREWILVGLADGTIGQNSVSGSDYFRQSQGIESDLYSDGRIAFFAKGQVRGDWLLTAAYDSDKESTGPFSQLIQPDQYYTLYGDNSEQRLGASSGEKLFIKLEKDRFYALLGDFDTGLNQSELGRYERKLTGFQTVFNGDWFGMSAFASRSDQRYIRDEIQGDGTSGTYFLSEKFIIPNSEVIKLQVRDRLRSEVIVSERNLFANRDYVINYLTGELFFKFPVKSTDSSFNPRFIVVGYETESSSTGNLTAGINVQANLDGLTSGQDDRVGITTISEDQGQNVSRLTALHSKVRVANGIELKTEVAQSEISINELANSENTVANALMSEITIRNELIEATAYIRQQQAGFGLKQQNQGEEGSRKYGLDGYIYYGDQNRVVARVAKQQSLVTDLQQTSAEVQAEQIYGLGRWSIGGRMTEQQNGMNELASQQLVLGNNIQLLDDSLTLSQFAEVNLNDTALTNDLLRLGADYRIARNWSVFTEREQGFDRETPIRTQAGTRYRPWTGASFSSSIQQEQSLDQYRLFQVNGVSQDIQLSESWQFSFGLDQGQQLAQQQRLETVANTQDFEAYFAGIGYRDGIWQMSQRLETRSSAGEDKLAYSGSIYRPIGRGFAFGATANWLDRKYLSSNNEEVNPISWSAELDLGYRPIAEGWAWLNQMRLINEDDGGEIGSNWVSERWVNSTHINYLWSQGSQIGVHLGVKKQTETWQGQSYDSWINLIGLSGLYQFTPKWDIGWVAKQVSDMELSQSKSRIGASIGRRFSNTAWISLGYNIEGFDDQDFSNNDYNAEGLYLKLRLKMDQNNLRNFLDHF